MLPLHHRSISSFHTFPFSLNKTYRKPRSGLGRDRPPGNSSSSSSNNKFSLVLGAVEKDSEFEVDPVQAREALRRLDEQFESLARKPDNPSPKIKASDLNRVREEAESETGLSGSFLATLGTGLVIFTVFYNIFFLTVIKPSIDGPDTYENISFDLEEVDNATLSAE